MSKFHRYSFSNTLLIFMQKPDSSLVAGYSTWKQLGRYVKKGEKGIDIIAPAPFKTKVPFRPIDPDTRQAMTDSNGLPLLMEREALVPAYKIVKVFDYAQTEGSPLPEIAPPLTGDVEHYEAFMEALRRSSGVPVETGSVEGGADGFFDLENQRIVLKEGMSQTRTVCTLVHEIAHERIHNDNEAIPEEAMEYDEVEAFGVPALFANERVGADEVPDGLFRYDLRGSDSDPGQPVAVERRVRANHAGTLITEKPLRIPENGSLPLTAEGLNFTGRSFTMRGFRRAHPKDRGRMETEAESVAYTVASYFSIEPKGERSFAYIASWSKDRTLPELRDSLETVVQASHHLITDIERNFAAVCMERGIPQAERREDALEKAKEATKADWEARKASLPPKKNGRTGKKRTYGAR